MDKASDAKVAFLEMKMDRTEGEITAALARLDGLRVELERHVVDAGQTERRLRAAIRAYELSIQEQYRELRQMQAERRSIVAAHLVVVR